MSKNIKSKKSKKFVLKSFTLPYNILIAFEEDNWRNPSELAKSLCKSKQSINGWLKKLVKEGLVKQSSYGIYEITWLGKKTLEGLRRQNNKNLVRLENMRYKYPILQGMSEFILAAFSKKFQNLGSIRVYHGEEYDHSYRIFAAQYNPCLEVTCPPRYGYNIYEMMYEAKNENQLVAQLISQKNGLVLGLPEPSMEPEWAIPSLMAEAILSKTCSSQIRTTKGTLNRSKGRNADLETRDIHLANDILNMPNNIKKISDDIHKLMGLMSYRSSWKIYNSFML